MIIKESAYPRAALVGNPSDGYHGKTIAFVFHNYSADVTLYETPELELLLARRDSNVFKNMDADEAFSVVYKRQQGGYGLICDDGLNLD